MTEDQNTAENTGRERIAKRVARAGICSRRDAERWIEQGRITVNGVVLKTPATLVGPEDVITADGKIVAAPVHTRLFRYYKPAGLVTSARDEKGRTTIFDKMPPALGRVVSVGRLDLNSEGLLLLTNDGELARHLELPSTGWARKYRVRVFGDIDEQRLAALAKGHVVSGVQYGPIEATIDVPGAHNHWLMVTLREGKNREIRKVMESLGLEVNRLIRVSYGPFQLGQLPKGAIEEVPPRVLRDQLGTFMKTGKAIPAPSLAPVRRVRNTLPPKPDPKPDTA